MASSINSFQPSLSSYQQSLNTTQTTINRQSLANIVDQDNDSNDSDNEDFLYFAHNNTQQQQQVVSGGGSSLGGVMNQNNIASSSASMLSNMMRSKSPQQQQNSSSTHSSEPNTRPLSPNNNDQEQEYYYQIPNNYGNIDFDNQALLQRITNRHITTLADEYEGKQYESHSTNTLLKQVSQIRKWKWSFCLTSTSVIILILLFITTLLYNLLFLQPYIYIEEIQIYQLPFIDRTVGFNIVLSGFNPSLIPTQISSILLNIKLFDSIKHLKYDIETPISYTFENQTMISGLICKQDLCGFDSFSFQTQIYIGNNPNFIQLLDLLARNIYIGIDVQVYVSIKNCSLKIDSPFLYTSSLMGISLDSLTFHESISDTLIMAISVKSLQVKNCYFYNISANCLKIGDIFDFEISNSIFSNIVSNLGAINYNDASSSSLKPFSGSQYHAILNTTFENCKGGALNFLTNNKVSIRNCNFYYNNAPEGSAILFKQDQTKSFLDVKNSKFIGNGSPTTYGGVAFIVGGASFTASIFENNVAERGGVVYVGEGAKFAIVAFLDSCEFINNSALLGNIGYTESPNPKSIFKNSNRSDTLFENEDVSSPCFKFDFQVFDAISGEKMDEKKMISPYLGQTLVIVIDPLDVYGKKIKGPNGLLSISTDNSKYLLRTGKASESGIRMEFTIFSHEKLESFEKFTLSLKFQRANSKIQVIVTDCPSLYIFDAAGCVNIWYWIPIASVLSSFIAGISLIAVIFICFARYKSQLLKRRKQADKEMEQVLLDKRIIFENDESPRTPKTFIISTDDIKIIKKIGEGGQGTVYQAKWNNKEVAIKSIKKDGIDDDDEFEKEATLLMSLSHPNIGK
ncbi:predicted protein [Naegleria gruberi]|uniref:Predicted protein n=1 Tax=Naegleria gruberi TaxID=5762 RepID=D2UX53_NAEGR|nr:uncharacterized protein NAEGRDRAFT_45288 [Naegleria gruberi]EFC50872.1 predicted protein [Naegleria gruberi]|eukprot:XP_002683616.1 predicted protein [Naegleria gruberi strain NEG-M]